MFVKPLLIGLCLSATVLNSHAQKVKRKGVTQNQPSQSQKNPVPLYTINQLDGKWQEVKRVSLDSNITIAFPDSLLMAFKEGKVELKDATSMRMTMKGEAQIEAPGSLVAAGDVYNIHSLSPAKLVVDDGEFLREFQKKDQFYYETLGKLKVEKDSIAEPVNIDIKNIKGKWLVYSRQAAPGATNDQTALIKSLEIISVSDDGIALGQAVFYTKDITKTLPCQVVTKDGAIKIVTDQYIWNFFVYKADTNEFVFGEKGKLVYYSKH